MTTITKHILASIFVTVLVVLGGWGYLELQSTIRFEMDSLLRDQRNIVERLAYSLAYPLWNLNRLEVEKTIHHEAIDDVVRAILVYDDSGEFYFGTIREGAKEEDIKSYNADNPPGQQLLSIKQNSTSREIIKNGKTIGKVFLYVNDDHLKSIMRHQMIALAFKLLGLVAALSCVQYLVLRKVVIQPLNLLKNWVLSIGPAQPPSLPKMSHSEEIDILAASFSEMAGRLTNSMEEQKKTTSSSTRSWTIHFSCRVCFHPTGN
jgi:hypothetical protein